MLADRTTWKYKKSLLPYKERLAYLESKGAGKTAITTDINIGQIYNSNNDITLDFKVKFGSSTSANYMLGVSTMWFTFERYYTGTYFNVGSTGDVCKFQPDHSNPIEISTHFTSGNAIMTGDYSAQSSWSGTIPSEILNLFGRSLNDSNKEGLRIYYFKLYNGSTLAYSYIPVLDMNDVPCMYDEVNNVFKYSIGTEDFNYGTL